MKKLVPERLDEIHHFERGGEMNPSKIGIGIKAEKKLPAVELLQIGKIYQCEVEGDFDESPTLDNFMILDTTEDGILVLDMSIPKTYLKFAKQITYDRLNSDKFYDKNQYILDEINEYIIHWNYNSETQTVETELGFKVFIDITK